MMPAAKSNIRLLIMVSPYAFIVTAEAGGEQISLITTPSPRSENPLINLMKI